MYVQNEIVVKWIHMVFYHDKFCYAECNLIFDDFFVLHSHPMRTILDICVSCVIA